MFNSFDGGIRVICFLNVLEGRKNFVVVKIVIEMLIGCEIGT